jgi:peroxiredoxin
MTGIEFLVYQGQAVERISYAKLFQGQRVLICSLPELDTYTSYLYLQHLVDHSKQYIEQGIDKVVVINSSKGVWGLMHFSSYSTELLAINDCDNGFVEWLKTQVGRTESVNYLAHNWYYQVLINHNNIEHFVDQPMTLDLKTAQSCLIEEQIMSLFKTQDYFVIRYIQNMLAELAASPKQVHEFSKAIESNQAQIFFFNHLWPNYKLSQYLAPSEYVNK